MLQAPAARMQITCVVLLWAVFSVSVGMISSQDPVSDDMEIFDGNAAAPPAPPAQVESKDRIELLNGDFELTTVTGNATTLADPSATTMIPNWIHGGAGVQVIQNSGYQMSSFAPNGVFAIHPNNPASTGNATQGSISTMNLTKNPPTATIFTVQFDCAGMPDGPMNLIPSLKISSMTGSITNTYILHRPRYNVTDNAKQITWIRQSFLFMGTGVQTRIQFESMSEKYGPLIDNVVYLRGKHKLYSNFAPPSARFKVALWQRMCLAFMVAFLHSCSDLCSQLIPPVPPQALAVTCRGSCT